ncbi:riboflavin kinase [Corynebacterium sp. YIM 101645]|uniref:riboflavin kinase n=1 Tax=Corynebacterium lemuris TaxID=1859292 RepID=A0ABT2FSP2_9CORY|nr:riboflavin kinase [Corynebacterium lemuris]MCS5478243.1 riboflavin kinase [Corynebacterium lemuris]
METIEGIVIPGNQLGRQLGFPTANIALPARLIPQALQMEGVWAGVATCQDETRWMATISIGRRPTFYGEHGELLLEAFLHDFSGDLYGTTLKISLRRFLREQLAFPSPEELILAMNSDADRTRQLLVSH